jgi:hypothetical protein
LRLAIHLRVGNRANRFKLRTYPASLRQVEKHGNQKKWVRIVMEEVANIGEEWGVARRTPKSYERYHQYDMFRPRLEDFEAVFARDLHHTRNVLLLLRMKKVSSVQ